MFHTAPHFHTLRALLFIPYLVQLHGSAPAPHNFATSGVKI